jgi:hypothetical protein
MLFELGVLLLMELIAVADVELGLFYPDYASNYDMSKLTNSSIKIKYGYLDGDASSTGNWYYSWQEQGPPYGLFRKAKSLQLLMIISVSRRFDECRQYNLSKW